MNRWILDFVRFGYFSVVFWIGGLMCVSERGAMESPGEEAGRSAAPASHTPALQPNGSNKIIGRNVNGTSKLQETFFIMETINYSYNTLLKSKVCIEQQYLYWVIYLCKLIVRNREKYKVSEKSYTSK